jgi:hypothetical protein
VLLFEKLPTHDGTTGVVYGEEREVLGPEERLDKELCVEMEARLRDDPELAVVPKRP